MLQELLQNPRSIVQILILAAAYFALLVSIRGTRGAGILKGAVFLVVVAFLGLMRLADFLGFDQIKLLLQGVLAGSFIALIIIFAPEMRRGLLRLAQAPFLAPLLHGPSLKMVDEVVNAAVKVSKNRIGALIAVERDVGLGEYIENGQRLDASLSSELLESIFYPGNPLHDGAVVIQHDRIAAAACLFPLTEDPNIARTMGTRHRAAIGISEETDAIVIVVSEETGRISVCVGGKIQGDLNRESLEKVLRDLYTRGMRSPFSFRRNRGEAAAAPPAEPAPVRLEPPLPTPEPDGTEKRETRKTKKTDITDKEKKTA
ncbi:MAG: TIGR00159 family protein [Planctomycetes bacterium]|nr:TIGR00159 family protein [Planctomycetota bacterium]